MAFGIEVVPDNDWSTMDPSKKECVYSCDTLNTAEAWRLGKSFLDIFWTSFLMISNGTNTILTFSLTSFQLANSSLTRGYFKGLSMKAARDGALSMILIENCLIDLSTKASGILGSLIWFELTKWLSFEGMRGFAR